MGWDGQTERREINILEKLSELSFRVAYMEDEMKESKEDRKELRRSLHELSKVIGDLVKKFDNQRSFIGGIVFVLSGIWAFILLFKEHLLGWFSRGS